MSIPDLIKPLFKNYDTSVMDPDRSAELIVLTVLTRGTLEQISYLFTMYCLSPGLLDTEIRDYNYLRRCTRAWEERGESSARSLKGKRLH